MKIFAISDLHLCLCGQKPMDIFGSVWDNYLEIIESDWRSKVTDEDLVIIAGDISWAMYLKDFVIDLKYIDHLPGKKLIIRGNHDYWWDSISKVRGVLPHNMFALQNDCVRFQDTIICGTRGWTIPERNTSLSADDQKIYNREMQRAEMSLQAMTKIRKEGDKIIFAIHYPPFNSSREHNEFMELFEKYKVNYVVYGHLHGKSSKIELQEKINGITYLLTSCDMVSNKLIEIL